MTKQTLIRDLVREGVDCFPDAEAIILWGGAARRNEIVPYGDIDVLIVLPGATTLLSLGTVARLQEYKTLFAGRTVDVDPFLTNAAQLAKSPLRFAGPRGEYHAHGLIHFQLKYDSVVIWGNQKVKDLIKPISLNAALNDIVPKVLTDGIQKIRVEYPIAKDPFVYIAENRNGLLIVARTIYALREGKLATKEEAISYIQKIYPHLKSLGDLLLHLYIRNKTPPTYMPSTEEIEDFLAQGETLIRRFLTGKSTGKLN
jgi:hypothetical protein